MLNEINQTEKDKYCLISHMWKLKQKQKQNKLIDIENILVVARVVGWKMCKGSQKVKKKVSNVLRKESREYMTVGSKDGRVQPPKGSTSLSNKSSFCECMK